MVSKEATKETLAIEGQNSYELVLIARPELEGEALTAITDNITRLITGKGGTVSQVEQWGKKKLAYSIKHFLEGTYILMQFKLEPASCKALETNLKITEDIIRYLLVKLDSSKD